MSVAVHKAKIEIFYCNQIVFGHKPIGSLVQVIRTLVSNFLMQGGDLTVGFSLAVRAFDLSRCAALQSAQLCEALSEPVRVLDQLTSRESSEALQANVNTHLISSKRLSCSRIGKFNHQADIPAVINPLDNDMLDSRIIWDRPMITQPNLADILDIETHPSVRVLPQLAAVAVGKFDAAKAVTALETGKSRFFSRLQAAKEGGKGLVKAAQKMLQTGSINQSKCIGVLAAQIPEMGPLRLIANLLARFFVRRHALLKGGIIDQSGLQKQKIQLFQLISVWAKEVLVSTKHNLTRLLHFNIPLDGFFGNLAYRTDIITSAPQARQSGTKLRELLAQQARGITFELVGKTLRCFGWIAFDKQMNVVWHDFERLNRNIQLMSLLIQQRAQFFSDFPGQNFAAILWTPNQMIFQVENASCVAPIPFIAHGSRVSHSSLSVNYLLKEKREGLPLPPKGGSPRPTYFCDVLRRLKATASQATHGTTAHVNA